MTKRHTETQTKNEECNPLRFMCMEEFLGTQTMKYNATDTYKVSEC